MDNRSSYRSLSLFFSLFLLCSLSSIAGPSGFSWKQDNTGHKRLYGTITRTDGSAPGGLELRLYSDPEHYPGFVYASGSTAEDGSFEFSACEGGSYLLEVQGEKGSGRVFIPSGHLSGPLDINYPVSEKVVVLHTNDQHFTINYLSEFSSTLTRIREMYEDVFLFSAGDVFVRHPLRWAVNGRLMRDPEWFGERTMYMISTMNDLGYDLMTPGNHEFAYREPYTRNALEAAEFPLLAANIRFTTEALPPMDEYVVLQTSTWRKVAVLGLSAINSGRDSIEDIGVQETVRNFISLRDSSDIFIALTHIGLKRDYELAGEFPQFDVIVGGHSHDLLKESRLVNSVLVAHAGGNPHLVSDNHPVHLGMIVLDIENGVVLEKKGWVIEIKAGVGQEAQVEITANVTSEAQTEVDEEAGEEKNAGIEALEKMIELKDQ